MIIEFSKNLNTVIKEDDFSSDYLKARIKVAISMIKIQIGSDLLTCGIVPTSEKIDKIWEGIPEDKQNTLISSYLR